MLSQRARRHSIRNPVPLAVDTDADGVEDGFDGIFPTIQPVGKIPIAMASKTRQTTTLTVMALPTAKKSLWGSSPYKADSDGDGVDDPTEIEAGTDPTDPLNL